MKPYDSWVDFALHAKNELSVVNFIAAYGTHAAVQAAVTLEDKRKAATDLVLGDGADWIWRYAWQFLGRRGVEVVEIVDIFHAWGHLWTVANAVFGAGTARAAAWAPAVPFG